MVRLGVRVRGGVRVRHRVWFRVRVRVSVRFRARFRVRVRIRDREIERKCLAAVKSMFLNRCSAWKVPECRERPMTSSVLIEH